MGKRDWKEACIAFFRNNAAARTGALVLAAVILVVGVCVAAHGLLFPKKEAAGSQVQSEQVVPEEVAVAEEDAKTEESLEVSEVADYAAVFLVTINPQLKIYVDADGIVLWVEAINDDAKALLETFSGEGKELKECFGQLLDKAYEAGYLHDDATVSIEAESMTDTDIEDMLDNMEQAAKTSCKNKGINIKMAVNKQDAESTIEKDIVGKSEDSQQSGSSDQTIGNVAKTVEQEEETTEQLTQPAQDTPDSTSGSSSDDGNGSSSGDSGNNTPTPAPAPSSGYHLVWADEFDGTELNRADWNVELHEPGWVNAELQKYVDSTDNISVKDGKLIITPIQTKNADGTYSYTSGRVNTQNKHDFKYGKFEARVKVPEGMGYLPAFWLMATDENVYGQWPRCGEIDIMEVMGQTPNKLHGTIHYGHNSSDGHHESQGTYILNNGKFSENFHTFTCEWEPGKITWYVDGIKYHEESDWYTAKSDGSGELTYPAPFDQNFYIILNLAVGGSWVGYPNNETFVAQPYEVDYVRVYQKDKYDENVKKPEAGDVIIREPDDNDNYLINGDFETAESLTDAANWQFKTAGTGVGSASIIQDEKMGSKAVKITTENAGDVDYAIQLLQDAVPLQAGGNYTLEFDAYASEARKVKVNSKAPNNGWYAYLDKTIDLKTEKDTYSYDFTMIHADDAECTVEFNMGALNSTADIVIDNVSLKLNYIDQQLRESIINPAKTVRADGNYIYNGEFQEGNKHLGYWNVPSGANVSVTSLEDGRRLKVVVPSNGNVTISQDNVPVVAGQKYELSLDAVVPAGGSVNIGFDGADYTVPAGTNGSWSQDFTTTSGTDTRNITIAFNGAGTYYLDNVRIDEDALIKNGSFKAGFSGFEPFVDGSASASYVVDTMNEDSAASFTINDTGDADWKVQLKQTGVELKKDQWYKLSLKMKSTLDRKVQVNIQRDGNLHPDEWTPYLQQVADVTSTYQTFAYEFQMTEADDAQSLFNIAMGAVGGTQISTQHTVVIDEIVLEEIEAKDPGVTESENMLKNPNFDGLDNWVTTWDTQWDANNANYTAVAEAKAENNQLIYTITNVGNYDYSVQLKQEGLDFEEGATYRASFDVSSTVARDIKFALMGSDWYAGVDSIPVTTELKTVTFDFTPLSGKSTYDDLAFQLSLGKVGEDSPTSTLTFANMKLVKLEKTETPETTPVEVTLSDVTLVKTKDNAGNVVSNATNLVTSEWAGTASPTVTNATITATVTNPGANPWDVQLQQYGKNLEAGCEYKLTFKGKASAEKLINVGLQQNVDPYTVYSLMNGQNIAVKLSTKEKSYTVTFTMNETGDNNATLFFNLGNVTTANAGYIMAADGESQAGEEPDTPETSSDNMFERGSFNTEDTAYVEDGTNVWDFWVAYSADSSASLAADTAYANGCMTVSIANEGEVAHGIQLKYQPTLTLEKGASYKLTFDATSSVSRAIVSQFQDPSYNNYGWKQTDLTAGTSQTVTVEFTYDGETRSDYSFCVNMGKLDGANAIGEAHTIQFDNFKLEKVGISTPTANLLLRTLNSGIVEMETTMEEVTSVEETTEEVTSVEETTEEESTSVEETPSVEETVVEEETTEEETEEDTTEEISTEE